MYSLGAFPLAPCSFLLCYDCISWWLWFGDTQNKSALRRIPFSISLNLTVVCSVKVFYLIYSPTGTNKSLKFDMVWYNTGLNQTDCHTEVTILRPNVSTLLSSASNQGWKPVSFSTPHRRPKSQTRWMHNVFIALVIEIQMTAILSSADSDVRESVDLCNTRLILFFSEIRYIKVHKATRWTIRHDLMQLWFKDLMNVTEKLQFTNQRFDTPV